MKYHYKTAVRWFRWTVPGDVRCHVPPKGWQAQAHLLDYHPITDKHLRSSQWWIKEVFSGDQR